MRLKVLTSIHIKALYANYRVIFFVHIWSYCSQLFLTPCDLDLWPTDMKECTDKAEKKFTTDPSTIWSLLSLHKFFKKFHKSFWYLDILNILFQERRATSLSGFPTGSILVIELSFLVHIWSCCSQLFLTPCDLDIWPTDMKKYTAPLLVIIYIPTKFDGDRLKNKGEIAFHSKW